MKGSPSDLVMNRQAVIVIAVVTAYLIWLVIFLLIIERWLRRLVEWLFGITITREFQNVTGPSQNISLLDGLFMFSWTVVRPASVSIRLMVGALRLTFWLLAVFLPIVIGFWVYFSIIRSHQS